MLYAFECVIFLYLIRKVYGQETEGYYGVKVMRTIEIEYSEAIPAILNITPEIFENEARLALAIKLYEMGRLTSGQAAQLAGVSRVTFLLECRKYGAASVEWDQEEIEAEFVDMNA